MIKIDTLYTTVSEKRTHVAADMHYLGSVNSYNNCFTRIFAAIFRCSIKVNFEGKTRVVNKKSYNKLISSLLGQEVKEKEIKNHIIFKNVAEKVDLSNKNRTMREAISEKNRKSLFKKLAKAISQNNTDKALEMIGKGAALDFSYFDRDFIGPSFILDNENLSSEKNYKFTVFKGPPILIASYKNNQSIVKKLYDFGANTSLTAEKYSFERKIVGVDRRVEFVTKPKVIVSPKGRVHHGFTQKLEERVSVLTKDNRTDIVKYSLNDDLTLVETAKNLPE